MASKPSVSLMFLLVATLIASCSKGVSADGCEKMTAAMRKGNTLYFFYGTRYIAFDVNTRQQLHTGLVNRYFKKVPPSFSVDAAYTPVTPRRATIFTSGSKYISFSDSGSVLRKPTPLARILPSTANLLAGLDAAVNYKSTEYLFKGCTLVLKRGYRVFKKVNLPSEKLPCNIDAAWLNRKNVIMISKGPHAWAIKGTTVLNKRPICFANSFKTEINICKCG